MLRIQKAQTLAIENKIVKRRDASGCALNWRSVVAQVSKPAVSPTSKSAELTQCEAAAETRDTVPPWRESLRYSCPSFQITPDASAGCILRTVVSRSINSNSVRYRNDKRKTVAL